MLRWNAADDSGTVQFRMEKVTTAEGAVIGREDLGMLEHSFSSIMGRTWQVPDGQGGVVPVPTSLIMGAIKVAFDALYLESQRAALPPGDERDNTGARPLAAQLAGA
jgi:hypothetical protein